MRSLKQMCVLTIVALTGGTLGVGSTFGWWQNDKPSADAPPKTESTSSVSGVALSVDSPSAIETLIKQLEAESRENAEEGKKELVAQTQRVIERLQQILKSSREHEAVAVPPKSPNVGIRKGQPDGAKSASAAQSGFVYIERARKSEVVVSDPIIQELKGQPDNPNEIEAVRQKREAVIRSLEKLRQQASERENENHDAPRRLTITKLKQSGETPTEIQILAGGPNLEEHLRQVADQLERSGQKDAARNIREGAERIQRDLRDTKVRNQAPRTQVDQVRVIEEEGSGLKRAVILRKIEAKPGEPAFYLQIDSDQGVQNSEKERRTKKNPDGSPTEKGDRAKFSGMPVSAEAQQHQELRKLFGELRLEISKLREEVRDLRTELKKERDDDAGDHKDGDDRDKAQGDKPGQGYGEVRKTKDPHRTERGNELDAAGVSKD